MFSLFMGLGRIPTMIIGIIAAISMFYGWLLVHDHNLREEVITEFNRQQEQLLADKQREFMQQMEALQKQNDLLAKQAKEKEVIVETKIVEIDKQINTSDKTSEAPLYYKELMKQLQKNFGDKK